MACPGRCSSTTPLSGRSVKTSLSTASSPRAWTASPRVPDTVEAMASLYVEVIRGHQPHGPYHFLSYCAGGSFAYEVARQLMSAGEEVGFLGFIDYPAPKQEIRSAFWSLYRHVCDICLYIRHNAGGAVAHISHFLRASPREKAASIMALPGFLAGKVLRLPAEINPTPVAAPAALYPEWITGMSGVQQAVAMKNYDAIGRYYPEACEAKVTIFMSSEQVRFSRRSGKYERTFGWKHLARGGVSSYVLKGDHGSVISPDNFSRIVRIARENIDKYRGSGAGHRH